MTVPVLPVASSPTLREQPGRVPLPRELYLESTNRCNERCDQCPRTHLGREPEKDLTLDEVRHITDQLPVLERVALHGLGEPLLNPALAEIVRQLRGRGARVLFNTNALLLNERRGRALIEAGLSELRVSLDGADPVTYGRVRGVNAKALPHIVANLERFTALQQCLGAEVPGVSLWFTAMRENIAELPGIVEVAARTGVREVYVQRFIYFGKGLAQAEQTLYDQAHAAELAMIRAAEARCTALGIRFRATGAATPVEYLARGERHQPRPWAGCQRPYTLAYITAHGNVFSCCFAPFHPGAARDRLLGNAFTQPFAAIWNGERYRAFRSAFESEMPWDQCAGCGSKWSL
jgi:MoaA/NifB/PqqE/SkfB family radical SAM enzyme